MAEVVFKTRVPAQKGRVAAHKGALWLSARALGPHDVFAWYLVEEGAEPHTVDLGYVPTGVEISETSAPGILGPHFIDTVTWVEEESVQVYHVFFYR